MSKIVIDDKKLENIIVLFAEEILGVDEDDISFLANDIVEALKEEGFTEENLTQEQPDKMKKISKEIRRSAGELEDTGIMTSMQQREVGIMNVESINQQNMELISNIERLERANSELKRNVEMMEDMYR